MIQASIVKRQRRLILILFGLILLTAAAGLGLGYSSLSFDRLVPTLLGQGTFKEEFVLFSVVCPYESRSGLIVEHLDEPALYLLDLAYISYCKSIKFIVYSKFF